MEYKMKTITCTFYLEEMNPVQLAQLYSALYDENMGDDNIFQLTVVRNNLAAIVGMPEAKRMCNLAMRGESLTEHLC
jgi:hypothetical protein